MFLGRETGLYELQRPLLSADTAFKQWVGAGTKLAGEETGLCGCPIIFESVSTPLEAPSLADLSPERLVRHKTPFSICSAHFSSILVQWFPQLRRSAAGRFPSCPVSFPCLPLFTCCTLSTPHLHLYLVWPLSFVWLAKSHYSRSLWWSPPLKKSFCYLPGARALSPLYPLTSAPYNIPDLENLCHHIASLP